MTQAERCVSAYRNIGVRRPSSAAPETATDTRQSIAGRMDRSRYSGMMNPSVASEECLDMTVAKCGGSAESWGYSGFAVANACAYRSTLPAGLLAVDDPVGPRNHTAILEMAAESDQVVIAHGRVPGQLQQHADAMVRILRQAGYLLDVLRLLDDGVPSHPLARGKGFIPKTTRPAPWV
jgi:hypothetical protein